jgi:3-hydroxybutyryl-CoA dehydrogenase
MDATSRIAVIGAGLMGGVIATLYAKHGHSVVLHDTNREALDGFYERLHPAAA